jgi:hypothetical protein
VIEGDATITHAVTMRYAADATAAMVNDGILMGIRSANLKLPVKRGSQPVTFMA